jgi:hypothetical protein
MWRQRREGRMVCARNDVLLCDERKWFAKVVIIGPTGCDSDHYMRAISMTTSSIIEHKAYLKGRKYVPFLCEYDFGPTDEADRLMADLQRHCDVRSVHNHRRTGGLDFETNVEVNVSQSGTKMNLYSVAGVTKQQELKRRIRSCLARDWKRRAHSSWC